MLLTPRIRRLAAALLTLCTGAPVSAAQGQSGFLPAADRGHLSPLEQVAVHELPPLDHAGLAKDDAHRRAVGEPLRFALPHGVDVSPWHQGTWETLEPGVLLWRYRVRSPGAANLNLGFDAFHLPEGASLHLYSADRVHVVRAFTAADNDAHGQLWTPVVGTDDLVVELRIPEAGLEDLRLHLGRIGQGYRPLGSMRSALGSGSCNVDVICAEGDEWRLEIPSVGLITFQGTSLCTGTLVTNVREDLRPYFLTANHCGIDAGDAPSLVVYWGFENSFCRSPGSSAATAPGDGVQEDFNSGAVLRATFAPSDFTLLELDDDPDPALGLSFAGWDATGVAVDSGTTIHHPDSAEKRISFEFQPLTVTSYQGGVVPGDGTMLRVTDWDVGTTEPGSSGAPLFDSQHRIVGQLRGGFAACENDRSDWYGRFFVSWTGGGTDATRLSNWLDPDGTGPLRMEAVSRESLCASEGTLAFSGSAVACDGSLELLLNDCDLDTDPLLPESLTLLVTSTSEPTGETVVLTETNPTSGRFRGVVPVSVMDAPGLLRVTDGDQVRATYVDLDDGTGGPPSTREATATVDCTDPSILSGRYAAVGPTSVTVRLVTSEPTLFTVDLGTTCGVYTRRVSSVDPSTRPTVTISGLLPDTTYFMRGFVVDAAGNSLLDDDLGDCYRVTTPSAPSTLTEEFLGDNDLAFRSLFFEPDGSPAGYRLCTRRIVDLPLGTAQATPLDLTDDGTALVELEGGKSVRLYGELFPRIFVSANGVVTFEAPDGGPQESPAAHFATKRISVYWDDFNPAVRGEVYAEQRGDRLVVTWLDVPQFNASDSNSFQLELFFDGRLRLSYAGMGSGDGVVGLSAGLGLPGAFLETDLGAAERCGPPVRRTKRP